MQFTPKMRDAFALWYARLGAKNTLKQAKQIIKQFQLPDTDKRRFSHEQLNHLIGLLNMFLDDMMKVTVIDPEWHQVLKTEIRQLSNNLDLRSPISYVAK